MTLDLKSLEYSGKGNDDMAMNKLEEWILCHEMIEDGKWIEKHGQIIHLSVNKIIFLLVNKILAKKYRYVWLRCFLAKL